MDSLLFFSTLVPSGYDSLAAVRFSSPVRVDRVRIFPKGSKPFGHSAEEAQTEPFFFSIDVFLNAQAFPGVTADSKPKASNALVKTTIEYDGTLSDFPLEMQQLATRLIIFKGAFEQLTLAIYGETLSPDSIPSEPTYNPTQLPTPHNSSLPPKLDPANSHDPLRLAKQLLALCPDPPKLSFVARLFLSFPAPSDQVEDGSEWADLTTLLDDYLPTQGWLEQVIHSLGKSILKETDITSIREFVERVRECVETHEREGYTLLFELLGHASKLPNSLVKAILDACDVLPFFKTSAMDESSLSALLGASLHPLVAKSLQSEQIRETLLATAGNPRISASARQNAAQVVKNIDGWSSYHSSLLSLTSDNGNWNSTEWLSAMKSENGSLGPFISDVISWPEYIPRSSKRFEGNLSLARNPLIGDFHNYIRAYVSVATTCSVFSWAVQEEAWDCCARVLGILSLWWETDSYREVVFQTVSMPQIFNSFFKLMDLNQHLEPCRLARRLVSQIFQEQPQALLRPSLAEYYDRRWSSLPFSAQTHNTLSQSSEIIRSGMVEAVRVVLDFREEDIASGGLFTLSVALSTLLSDFDSGEPVPDNLVQEVWYREGDLLSKLILLLQFTNGLLSPSDLPSTPILLSLTTTHHLDLAATLLQLTSKSISIQAPLDNQAALITKSTVGIFLVAEQLCSNYFAHTSALALRQATIDLLQMMSATPSFSTPEIVLNNILSYPLLFRTDMADVTSQVFRLLSLLLPNGDVEDARSATWVRALVATLPGVHQFSSLLDAPQRLALMQKLDELDVRGFGLVEWLLAALVKDLPRAAQCTSLMGREEQHKLKAAVATSLLSRDFVFLLRFAEGEYFRKYLSTVFADSDIARVLSQCLIEMNKRGISCTPAFHFAACLASSPETVHPRLAFSLALTLVRAARMVPPPLSTSLALRLAVDLLERGGTQEDAEVQRILLELGSYLAESVEDERAKAQWDNPEEAAEAIVMLLQRLCASQEASPLPCLSAVSFDSLALLLTSALPMSDLHLLDIIRERTNDTSEAQRSPKPSIPVAGNYHITTVGTIQQLVDPSIPITPSTPPRRHLTIRTDGLDIGTLSPTTVLRSPTVTTGLTKTYNNNDFRQIRTSPTTNSSRPPSRHVDEFESESSSQANVQIPQASPALAPLNFGSPIIPFVYPPV